ncbi:hypothetical protein BXZ70DRAFT_253047 [Cristinia sonorae]|uniref:DUF6535 domain-containing protein n=1 Tax=Cristinia sonorae TaxID=1940300 RepID=A0A8K0XU15_9AGAR|nr:hypothetical protein BXZ70DRAFT_253047 [Cristinia sonorae]
MHALVQRILDTLQKSDIIDPRLRFWSAYRGAAERYDDEFLRKYNNDMDSSMILAGLFSAVCASFAQIMAPDLSPDSNVTTQLLLQALLVAVNGTSPLSTPIPSTWAGPTATAIWVQSLLYASLSCSLFAVLGAVLAKQWLINYSGIAEKGTIERRSMDRQAKLDAIETWHLVTILEIVPILLQMSLLLFGVALSAYILNLQRGIGYVLIVINGIGALLYSWFTLVPLFYTHCPFKTSLTSMLLKTTALPRQLHRFLASKMGQTTEDMESDAIIWPSSNPLREEVPPTNPTGIRRHLRLSLVHLQTPLRFIRSSIHWFLWRVKRVLPSPRRHLQDENFLTASATAWLMETTTDPLILVDSMWSVPSIVWPDELIKQLPNDLLERLLSYVRACFQRDHRGRLALVGASRSHAVAFSYGFLSIYWQKIRTSNSNMLHDVSTLLRHLSEELSNLLGEVTEQLADDVADSEDCEVFLLLRLTLVQMRGQSHFYRRMEWPAPQPTFRPLNQTKWNSRTQSLCYILQGDLNHGVSAALDALHLIAGLYRPKVAYYRFGVQSLEDLYMQAVSRLLGGYMINSQ